MTLRDDPVDHAYGLMTALHDAGYAFSFVVVPPHPANPELGNKMSLVLEGFVGAADDFSVEALREMAAPYDLAPGINEGGIFFAPPDELGDNALVNLAQLVKGSLDD